VKLRITIDGQTYDAEVEILEAEESEPAESTYEPAPVEQLPPQRTETEAGAGLAEPAERDSVCRSPVNGIVVKINVETGQKIHAGDLLLVLESMKMETHVTAYYDTAIKTILVAPGNSVRAGQPLVEFEPAGA